jgi:type I restriction enzyme S subunit
MKLTNHRLGDIAKFVRGITFKPEDVVPDGNNESVVCFRTKNVQTDLDVSDVLHLPRQFVKRQEQYITSGDMLMSTANSWNLVGKLSWVPQLSYEATAGGFISILRPDPKIVAPRFLYHWATSPMTQDAFRNCGRQTTNISNLSFARALALEVPLPPLEEQKRIAAVLDKADALRRKRQEALRLTDDFLRSTFLDMFGDPEQHGWTMQTVADLLAPRPNAIRTGPFGSQLLHSEFVDSGIAVLGIDNAVQNEFRWGKPRFISEEKYEQLRRYTVHPGDVIITIMGTVGRCAIVPADIPTAINTKHLCCLTLDRSKCLPEFLHTYFLTHPIARRYFGQSAKGAIMDGLNMGLIKALPVPKVPLHLQQRFSDIAKQVQKTALQSAQASQKSETLFSALQQRAFSGQL